MYIWRLLTDKRVKCTMADLEDTWTLEDMQSAHFYLDVMDFYEIYAHKAAKK